MKFRRRIGLALALAALPAWSEGMRNEPGDFFGIAWGASESEHKGALVTISEDGATAHYRRASDRLSYAGVDARRITYRFYKGQFSGGTVLTVGTREKNAVIAHLTERYGAPEVISSRHPIYRWTGERAGIMFSCDISGGCYSEFYDRTLKQQEEGGEASVPGLRRDDD